MNAPGTTDLETQAASAAPSGGNGDRPRPGPNVGAGYLFWGVTIGVILLVELLGALGGWLEDHIGVDVPWTTISGMVGHLEDLWPATAVIVVGVLAPAAFYALAPVGLPNELGPLRRGASGRWHRQSDEKDPPRELWRFGYPPWLVFAICAVIALAAVLVFEDDYHRAYVIYGALFLFGIVVPSILVLARRKVGYPSLFVTVNHLRDRRDLKAVLATVALSAGLAILVIHLAFYPWPDITKPPVQYAGLTANEARSKANKTIEKLRVGAPTHLFYSTQTRGVLNAHEAWLVYFTAAGDVDSGCVVTVTDKAVDTTEQCKSTG